MLYQTYNQPEELILLELKLLSNIKISISNLQFRETKRKKNIRL